MVAQALLDAGVQVEVHDDHFPQNTSDEGLTMKKCNLFAEGILGGMSTRKYFPGKHRDKKARSARASGSIAQYRSQCKWW